MSVIKMWGYDTYCPECSRECTVSFSTRQDGNFCNCPKCGCGAKLGEEYPTFVITCPRGHTTIRTESIEAERGKYHDPGCCPECGEEV